MVGSSLVSCHPIVSSLSVYTNIGPAAMAVAVERECVSSGVPCHSELFGL